MSSKKLDQNIIYFSEPHVRNYKINIYNLSKKLFEKLWGSVIYFGYLKNIRYDEINIYDIIYIRDFVYFDLSVKNFPIKQVLENFYNITEEDIIELIKLFELYSIIDVNYYDRGFKIDNECLLQDLKRNYKKYLNEATIKNIIE